MLSNLRNALLLTVLAGAALAQTEAASPITTPAPIAPAMFHPEAICRTLCDNHSITMAFKDGPVQSLEGTAWELAQGKARSEPFHRFEVHGTITGTDGIARRCWFVVGQHGTPEGNLGLGRVGQAILDVRLEHGDPARPEDAVLVAVGPTRFWHIETLDDKGLIETIDDGVIRKTVSTFETGEIDLSLSDGLPQHVTGPVRVSVYTEPDGTRRILVRVHYKVADAVIDPPPPAK